MQQPHLAFILIAALLPLGRPRATAPSQARQGSVNVAFCVPTGQTLARPGARRIRVLEANQDPDTIFVILSGSPVDSVGVLSVTLEIGPNPLDAMAPGAASSAADTAHTEALYRRTQVRLRHLQRACGGGVLLRLQPSAIFPQYWRDGSDSVAAGMRAALKTVHSGEVTAHVAIDIPM